MTEKEKLARIASLDQQIEEAEERARRETSRWRWERRCLKLSISHARNYRDNPEHMRRMQKMANAGAVAASEKWRARKAAALEGIRT